MINPFKLAEKSHRTPREIWEYFKWLERQAPKPNRQSEK
jgi:hypothetical protein